MDRAADETLDVIIAGGGPVGLTLALALVRFGPDMRVALIDQRPLSPPRDERASAITAGVSAVFEALGLWDEMAKGAEPVRAMKVTDSGSADLYRPVYLDFAGEVAPGKPFAHMVPNRQLAEVLIGAVKASGIDIVAPDAVTGFEARAALGHLTLRSGATRDATLVVAADGGRSTLRELAGIGTQSHDYRQSGLVATIAHELPHDGVAWEHFLPAGPFASLPLNGNRSSLVWTESTGDAARLKALDAETLGAEIEARMGSRLGKISLDGEVQVFPLHRVLARSMIAPRLALVGDAAHLIHPLAGQGLNLGIRDVAALAETVIQALRQGEDFGAPPVLTRYADWRRADVMRMAAITHGLNRLFSNDYAPLRALRDAGLGIVDRIAPLKQAMIAEAAGLARRGAPSLTRGEPI